MAKPGSYTEVVRCGHCGNRSQLRLIGSVSEVETDETDPDFPYDAGHTYHVCACPSCSKVSLQGGYWDDRMDPDAGYYDPILIPDESFLEAQQLLAQRAADRQFMEMAVAEASKSKCEPEKAPPRVGAVVARENKLIIAAHRGEKKMGEHAEYTALEGKCEREMLAGATVYTTLEPCTGRNYPKTPCVDRLIARKVARVVIGMLDPDERIRGRGILALRKANIRVDLFPPDLMNRLEEMNRDFIKDREGRAHICPTPAAQPVSNVIDKWVSSAYADKAGITAKLSAEGYSVAWVAAETENEKIDFEGWEHVLEKADASTQCRLKIRDDSVTYLVLLKKKGET